MQQPDEIGWHRAVRFNNSRVLVADSSSVNAEYLREFLTEAGCRPFLVTNAQSFRTHMQYAAYDGDPFRLALVDIGILDSGLEDFCEWIEDDPGLCDAAVVFMLPAGEKLTSDERELNTLSKPITDTAFGNCLVQQLESDRVSNSVASSIPGKTSKAVEKPRQIRILVADDNTINQRVATAMLEKSGYAVEVVNDGEAAIRALETEPFDLVFMVCFMPVMDGFEATRAIRSDQSRVIDPKVPVIALTALDMEYDRQKWKDAGMDDYVSKPVDRFKLIEAIERCLTITREVDENSIREKHHEDPQLSPSLLDSILELFIEEAPQQIADLQAAFDNNDFEGLKTISHKIRGSAGFLGTNLISVLASEVETAVMDGETGQAVSSAADLLTEMRKLLVQLTVVKEENTI